jgi:predicted ABC-type ATPase
LRRFVFETTLGGRSMTGLLLKAANVGIPVRIVYVGLESADLHLRRVRARVRRGGHDIPEERIRQRYSSSRRNLVQLIPHLAELRVLDNSADADPTTAARPEPKPIRGNFVPDAWLVALAIASERSFRTATI